jgi:protein-disulfide isomerase
MKTSTKQELENKEAEKAKESSDSDTSKHKLAGPEKTSFSDKKSERTENIVALTVFAFLIILGIGLFTDGFGLLNKKSNIDDSQRINVPLGDDPLTEAKDPKVVIVAFSDYECPFCGRAEQTMKNILAKYPGQILYIFKDAPLVEMHPHAYGAALAAECAKEQGKYWEYHDYLFAHQDQLELPYLKEYAQVLGLDTTKFNSCLESEKYKIHVDADIATAQQVGVTGTPTFFINGIMVIGAQPESTFTEIIDSEIKARK